MPWLVTWWLFFTCIRAIIRISPCKQTCCSFAREPQDYQDREHKLRPPRAGTSSILDHAVLIADVGQGGGAAGTR
ncbi:hypothetical protein B0H67DRAFT_56884 [Lasiosphaeris hirsuta]|uniref:Secreted protein n=1 Tax=Lasiosphaeris hirsuta TaxID=260670 RepID=A0AA40BB72_9PEZI|nr:hypothetical protein B0H67DRAFT_56884 [Lasiosphaeris hirsuta]